MLANAELLVTANVQILPALHLGITVAGYLQEVVLHDRLLQRTVSSEMNGGLVLRVFKSVVLFLTLVAPLGKLAQWIEAFDREVFFDRHAGLWIKYPVHVILRSLFSFWSRCLLIALKQLLNSCSRLTLIISAQDHAWVRIKAFSSRRYVQFVWSSARRRSYWHRLVSIWVFTADHAKLNVRSTGFDFGWSNSVSHFGVVESV